MDGGKMLGARALSLLLRVPSSVDFRPQFMTFYDPRDHMEILIKHAYRRSLRNVVVHAYHFDPQLEIR